MSRLILFRSTSKLSKKELQFLISIVILDTFSSFNMRLLLMTLMVWGLGCAKDVEDQRQTRQDATQSGGKKDAFAK